MKEIFEVTVWCKIEELNGLTAKDADELVHQLKDLRHHCVEDIFGLRQFRIDDGYEIVSDNEDDYDENSLVSGEICVYGAVSDISIAKEFAWDARETFEAFELRDMHYTITG